MRRKIIAIFGFIAGFILNFNLFAQVEQEGNPMILNQLKSGREKINWFKTPALSNEKYFRESNSTDSDNHLKPLKFAHSFSVSLSTENSGTWIEQEGYRIWTIGVESEGAYSINLIFSKYKLPNGARLFIYNEDKSDVIGAFTSKNNQESGMLATMPVAGDKIIVQYEEPCDCDFQGELEISKISHDFLGIKLKSKDSRRPLGQSGSCNVDINCDLAKNYKDAKNSVCRIYIDGSELCSGTLLNNTSINKKPYVLSARHCIENSYQAQVSVFLFNYESPYCNPIDGDDSHSISGSTLKASLDSLDFSLVELSIQPPNYYRPYYAGWDISGDVTTNTYSIHHPLGDIKKIAIDNDAPTTDTYNSGYVKSAFWLVGKWENGVTEIGSSGGPLFDAQSRVIGTLTGGAAICTNPVKDYFEKLSKSWNYKSDQTKQLKAWLDPINSGEKKIVGYNPYSGESKCKVLTNLLSTDKQGLFLITETIPTDGYWSGTNTKDYKEFAEKFVGIKSCNIQGVSMGIAKKYRSSEATDQKITVKVYDGNDTPTTLLHSQEFVINSMVDDAMNYFAFNKQVSTTGNFFISYSLNLLNVTDTFAVYNAKRELADNTFFLKNSLGWKDYKTTKSTSSGTALVMEVVACNVIYVHSQRDILYNENSLSVFPNPIAINAEFTVRTNFDIHNSTIIRVYDLLGKDTPYRLTSIEKNSIKLMLEEKRAGIYFVVVENEGKRYTEKISIIL